MGCLVLKSAPLQDRKAKLSAAKSTATDSTLLPANSIFERIVVAQKAVTSGHLYERCVQSVKVRRTMSRDRMESELC